MCAMLCSAKVYTTYSGSVEQILLRLRLLTNHTEDAQIFTTAPVSVLAHPAKEAKIL